MRDSAVFSGELVPRIKSECPGTVKAGEPLSAHTTLRIGGPAECWFEPADTASLQSSLRIARSLGKPVTVIGAGSNLLVSDEGVKGLVVHLSAPVFKEIRLSNGLVEAGAAVRLQVLIDFLVKNGLGECEYLSGIPAQLGGTVMMNSGSGEKWIGQRCEKIEGVDFGGGLFSAEKERIPFAYRHCGLKDLVITKVFLLFPEAPSGETLAFIRELTERRKRTQDLKSPSAGCVFRNPSGTAKSAGQLIDEAGQKGKRIGGAEVSGIHANFIVNRGGATQKDFLSLVETVEHAVWEKFRIRLEREIKVLS